MVIVLIVSFASCIIYSPSLAPRAYYSISPYLGAGLFNPMFMYSLYWDRYTYIRYDVYNGPPKYSVVTKSALKAPKKSTRVPKEGAKTKIKKERNNKNREKVK